MSVGKWHTPGIALVMSFLGYLKLVQEKSYSKFDIFRKKVLCSFKSVSVVVFSEILFGSDRYRVSKTSLPKSIVRPFERHGSIRIFYRVVQTLAYIGGYPDTWEHALVRLK